MSQAHSRTNLMLIINHLLVFVNSLTFPTDSGTMYLPTRETSRSRASGNDNGLHYDGIGSSSRGSPRKSREMGPDSSGKPRVGTPEETKVETISQKPLSSPAVNLTAARAQDGLRGAIHHSQKSQSLVAVAGAPYYPIMVGFRRVYTIPYPWVYYAVPPTSWRPPVTPVVNIPVIVHVHPQIVPVQVPAFVANVGGGVDDGSGVAGSSNPTAQDGIDAGFVPTYRCGTVKAANCQG